MPVSSFSLVALWVQIPGLIQVYSEAWFNTSYLIIKNKSYPKTTIFLVRNSWLHFIQHVKTLDDKSGPATPITKCMTQGQTKHPLSNVLVHKIIIPSSKTANHPNVLNLVISYAPLLPQKKVMLHCKQATICKPWLVEKKIPFTFYCIVLAGLDLVIMISSNR